MGIEGEQPKPFDTQAQDDNPVVTHLYTPGEPAVDANGNFETVEEVIGPWSEASLTEFAEDSLDLSEAVRAAAKHNPRFIY